MKGQADPDNERPDLWSSAVFQYSAFYHFIKSYYYKPSTEFILFKAGTTDGFLLTF